MKKQIYKVMFYGTNLFVTGDVSMENNVDIKKSACV